MQDFIASKIRFWIMSLLLVAAASNAQAAYVCAGKIDAINQPYDGSVLLNSAQLYGNQTSRQICSLKTTWKGIDPAVCKGWLASLLASQYTERTITVQYNDSLTACSQQPAFGEAGSPWAMW